MVWLLGRHISTTRPCAKLDYKSWDHSVSLSVSIPSPSGSPFHPPSGFTMFLMSPSSNPIMLHNSQDVRPHHHHCWEWGGRQCGRDHTIFCSVGRTYVWEMWSNIIRRERETHKEYNPINKSMQQLQMNNNLYKRLQSHFI